jgi:hypothetical protein
MPKAGEVLDETEVAHRAKTDGFPRTEKEVYVWVPVRRDAKRITLHHSPYFPEDWVHPRQVSVAVDRRVFPVPPSPEFDPVRWVSNDEVNRFGT